MHPDNENSHEVLGYVNKALINTNKAIDDFEISEKIIIYGLFHL